MPRYFFDLVHHTDSADEVGTELVDDDAALIEAVRFTGQYLYHNPELPGAARELRVSVRHELGNYLFAIETRAVAPISACSCSSPTAEA